VSRQFKFAFSSKSTYPVPFLDRLLLAAPRHNAILLLFLVSAAVAMVGVFVIRDMRAANVEAQSIYTGSVHGLQMIGELQYDAQETRRATLYALTTSDSNLQVEYAGQSRDADQHVKDDITEYGRRAERPAEVTLANRLTVDWTNYLNVRDEVLALILEGSTREAVSLDLSKGVPTFELVRRDLREVKRLYDEDASQRHANLVASSRRSSFRLIGILGFTFLLSSAGVWAIQRSRMLSMIQLANLQTEFVASVSHELRTPLAVLSSAADNIADGLVEGRPSLRRYGAILQNQTQRMRVLVDQILLFASTEDGKSRYLLQPLQVSRIVESVLNNCTGLIKAAGFVVDEQVEPDLPLVMGDLAGISQCLQNLIGNAVKYSGDHRQISLRAVAAPSAQGIGREVRISVVDRGIGVDPSEIPRIFEPFFRSPRVNAMQIPGTGLGLSLSKRIAEAMGGQVSVSSVLSAGSTFTLHLQIAKREDLREAAASSRRAPPLNL
jgi:signal transduction histidine kinase